MIARLNAKERTYVSKNNNIENSKQMIILNNSTPKGMWENQQKNVEKPDKYIFIVKKTQFLKEFT